MLTWAICWLVVKMGGASEGIGVLLLAAMIFDALIIIGSTIIIKKGA